MKVSKSDSHTTATECLSDLESVQSELQSFFETECHRSHRAGVRDAITAITNAIDTLNSLESE